jgi:hypothetical protein
LTAVEDFRALEQRGECLRPARDMFEFCCDLAAQTYATTGRRAVQPRPFEWSSGHTTNSDTHVEIALQGATYEAPKSFVPAPRSKL